MTLLAGTLVTVRVYPFPGPSGGFTHRVKYDTGPAYSTLGSEDDMVVCVLGWEVLIAANVKEYLVEVPTWCENFEIGEEQAKKLADKCGVVYGRVLGSNVAWVHERGITICASEVKTTAPVVSGMKCSGQCGEHNLWAEANQEDGTFVCFSCRQDPYRASVLNVSDPDR